MYPILIVSIFDVILALRSRRPNFFSESIQSQQFPFYAAQPFAHVGNVETVGPKDAFRKKFKATDSHCMLPHVFACVESVAQACCSRTSTESFEPASAYSICGLLSCTTPVMYVLQHRRCVHYPYLLWEGEGISVQNNVLCT